MRDLVYRPPLAPERRRLDPRGSPWWSPALVRDQGNDPSCTGHAVASCVDLLLAIERHEHAGEARPDLHGAGTGPYASAIMLYGNAKLHDEWHGESYAGSSLRGALKGFQHNGVCSIVTARKQFDRAEFAHPEWRWRTSVEVHDEAMRTMLGVYMRVEPRLADMHAALTEARSLVATVRVHEGWHTPAPDGRIVFDSDEFALKSQERCYRPSYHALVVIGFDETGFLVQNSWGRGWGSDGLAYWTYPDWAHNVVDVWAMRLGAPAADAFRYSIGAQGVAALSHVRERARRAPTRLDVLGHIVPVTDGRFVRYGRYHIDRDTLDGTFGIIETRRTDEAVTGVRKRAPASGRRREPSWYRHVLFHFLGGTRDADSAGRMVRALHPVYTANGIYPLFLLWEEPLGTEVRGQVERALAQVRGRIGPGSFRDPFAARLAELEIAAVPARYRLAFETSADAFMAGARALTNDDETGAPAPSGDGRLLFADLFRRLAKRHEKGEISYHFVAHDIGARLLAAFFRHHAHVAGGETPVISSLHLVSPLLRREEFDAAILPCLVAAEDGPVRRRAKHGAPLIEQATLWCLDEHTAAGDLFAEAYPYSWPELWTRVEALSMDGGLANPMVDAVDDASDREKVGRTRLLALHDYARSLKDRARHDGYLVAVETVGEESGPRRLGLTHFGLDASPKVVGGILSAILGPDAVRRPYTEADFADAVGG